jgi:transmembrane sensor
MNAHSPETMQRLGEASQWLARLRADPASEDNLRGWLRWCEQHPANAEAFERIEGLWGQFGQVAGDFVAASPGAPEPQDREARDRAPRAAPLRRSRRRLVWLVAASVLLAVGAGVGWHATQSAGQFAASEAATTENRLISLPDGSSLQLSARTQVSIAFEHGERRLRMSEGEAYFKVQHDRNRPFVVSAGGLAVKAVGTAFDIKSDASGVTVTVEEGVVAVSPLAAPGGWRANTAWQVGPGYQFHYTDQEGNATLTALDTSAATAWREGRLEYVNVSLKSVIADVNRYSARRIEIGDSAAAALTFTGTVLTASVHGWLEALPSALPIRIDRSSGDADVIYARPLNRR